ncbi:unnamed protein product [Cylicocyclus nassatus]|uniref:Uncharacterized protein n=1 Tax=Cylicocyclus nassatus TaxID=53992 RepID=A0AA36GVH2_CYLNA|nr:unnamed protein product [Cylicocyclus nassatus]
MDAMLQYLLVLIYIRMVIVLAISCCAKKQAKLGSSTMKVDEPPKRKYFAPFKPRIIALNEKEVLIKGGLKAGQHAYPTLDDIVSDWSDKEELKKKGDASRESESKEREVLKIPALEEKSDERRASREVSTPLARTAMLPMKSDPAKASVELDKTSDETYKPSYEKVRCRGETPRGSRRTSKKNEESASTTPLGSLVKRKKSEKPKKTVKKKTARVFVTAEGNR